MLESVSEPFSRRLTSRSALLATALIGTLLIAACNDGGGSADPAPTARPTQDLAGQEIEPIPLNSELAVGDDRFVMGLQTAGGDLVLGGDLTMSFYTLEGETGTLAGEAPATYVSFVEGEDFEVGAYVAHFQFDAAGDWGVDVAGTVDGQAIGPVKHRFTVVADAAAPAIGEPAPRSEQVTLDDVDDISEIDSSDPPNPELHELTVAEALDLGKPLVIAFATPAFCTSRICGPVMGKVVLLVRDTYGDRIAVIHIEPYDLARARSEGELVAVPVLDEWGLTREPWIFVVDAQGRVAGKFEGISSAEEVEEVLDRLLS